MAGSGHNNPPSHIAAELVRIETRKVDIKLVIDGEMHLLAWRRRAFFDEVLVNNVRQQASNSLVNRETLYGLVFGKSPEGPYPEGRGGVRILFTVDPRQDWSHMDWNGHTRLRGVRLESGEGVLLAYGSLDPRAYQTPTTFSEWIKKSLGISY